MSPKLNFSRTFAALLLILASPASAQSCDVTAITPDYKAAVAHGGWEYRIIANGLRRPRGIVVDSSGALLVVDSGSGIKRIVLEDRGGTCFAVREQTTLVGLSEVCFMAVRDSCVYYVANQLLLCFISFLFHFLSHFAKIFRTQVEPWHRTG